MAPQVGYGFEQPAGGGGVGVGGGVGNPFFFVPDKEGLLGLWIEVGPSALFQPGGDLFGTVAVWGMDQEAGECQAVDGQVDEGRLFIHDVFDR
ncbi:hypothetical protein [Candidatus Vondammii sp. HM_W22]|uniref:hypothetical protein n=1 Tax=Candidatus Vondammii sp. HM_W22 TaxID=2687299 RepID=UPI001F12F005|nr:hypothetical protein [Candidatus Vondammii sp. HM_W22]